ncbi:MAG: diaminopimelate epimerase [Acidobacteriota bacterium]|nr:diaminopimelate epimerase [Acidobacteriota bacterium]
MNIPFTKAHGALNDFLLTWREELPRNLSDIAAAAIAICHRHTGIGADGWLLLSRGSGADGQIELWNSDGSRSEISGNGTRCAAALLVEQHAAGPDVRIATGAGLKHLRLLGRKGHAYSFEMNMGAAAVEDLHASIEERECTILNVGNPQCVFFVDDFDFEWQALGARIERHPRFPQRTNVSFVRVVNGHTLDVRFFERGAGETMSSGTGSTGAAAAALARGLVSPPVQVITPAGPLALRWEGEAIFLAGPAELIGNGEFFWKGTESK